MWEVDVFDLIKKVAFKKTFDSEYKLRDFLRKCKYSKKIKVTGVTKW